MHLLLCTIIMQQTLSLCHIAILVPQLSYRAFHTALAMHLTSESGEPLESTPITSVLEAVLERHPGLRVTFHQTEGSGKLVQRVHPLRHFNVCSVQTIDLQQQPNQQTSSAHLLAEEGFQSAIQEEVCKPFDLCSQVFRFTLFRPSSFHAVLLMVFHHIAFDGASLHILAKETLLLLNGELLPKATAFQHGKTVKEKQKLQRWANMFESAVHCTRISSQRPGDDHAKSNLSLETSKPALLSSENAPHPVYHIADERECGYQYLKASVHTSKAIQSLARSWNASPMLVVTTAFALTLHHYTGISDIIFGVMTLGRDHHTQNTVGYLASQLPFRVNFSPSGPAEAIIGDLLAQVRKNWELILDGGVELQDLVPHLPCLRRKANTLPTSPLQVGLSYYKVSSQTLPDRVSANGTEVRCELVVPRSGHTHVDLFCEAQPMKAKGSGTLYQFFWEYRKSVLVVEEVRRLHDLMCQLIEAMANCSGLQNLTLCQLVSIVDISTHKASTSSTVNPTTPADKGSSLSLNCSSERKHRRLSVALGPTLSPASSQYCPYILRFEEKCSAIPSSPAFRYNGKETTYGEAKLLASQLAWILRENGVEAGEHVGLYMSRTPWLYLLILAVLKCGAAYVPIALQNPRERIATILQLAESKILITENALLQSIPQYNGAFLCLEEIQERLEGGRFASLPTPSYSPDQLFYIIFTSGTTGTPKGVAITNGNMHTTIANFQALISAEECSFTLASINVSFDAHVLDSLAPLLSGACLVVVENIMDEIVEGVSFCVSTPSAASVVSFPASMRAIIVGGEAFSEPCYLNTRHIPKVYNAYGPSECTIFVTAQRIVSKSDTATIGKPVPGVKALVLDNSNNLVPIGESGILHIAGATVSKVGYYNNPEKTRKTFLRSPYNSSEFLYRTGDQVRMLPDGNLQFLGRVDDQAKVRGMRIQLLEVENTLILHPAVTSAKAMVIDKGTPNAKLVAFVTPSAVSVESVLQLSASKLPSFMVPSIVVPLAQLPLTKEGKVDKRALAALPVVYNPKLIENGTAADAEATKREGQVARIFARVLGITGSYPAAADFFASGGHSLQTFQLVSLLNQQMGCQLSIAHILQHPTPASLAPVIEQLLVSRCIANSSLHDPSVQLPKNTALFVPHQTEPHTHGKSVPQPQVEKLPNRQIDWSNVNYLAPVPDVPLSPGLLAKLESFLQRDPVARATRESTAKALSEELVEDTGYEVLASSLCCYPSVHVLQSHLKLKMVHAFTSTATDPLVQLHPPNSPNELPVFFVHVGIIGWPLPYLKLAISLGRHAIALQRSKDAPTASFSEFAAFYVSAIRSIQPRGPYRMIGVCYGAALVYEISKHLSDDGETVELAVLIGGSPVNEKRPKVFNEHGQPLPNTPAHPLHFLQSNLQLCLPLHTATQLNTTHVKVDEVLQALLSAFPWVPFTSEQLRESFTTYLRSLKFLWFNYTPQPGAKVKKCLLIHNQQHPFYQSHDYGLLGLLAPSSSLSVLIPPKRLGLLSEAETLDFVRSVVSLYL